MRPRLIDTTDLAQAIRTAERGPADDRDRRAMLVAMVLVLVIGLASVIAWGSCA